MAAGDVWATLVTYDWLYEKLIDQTDDSCKNCDPSYEPSCKVEHQHIKNICFGQINMTKTTLDNSWLMNLV